MRPPGPWDDSLSILHIQLTLAAGTVDPDLRPAIGVAFQLSGTTRSRQSRMRRERLAVCTALHPGCEPFVAEWYESLCQQTDLDFDLWIALDCITLAEARTQIGGHVAARWVAGSDGEGSAAVRQRLYATLVKGYDKVVFVDPDDLLGPTYIAAARAALRDVDVAGCRLRLIGRRGGDLGCSFGPGQGTNLGLLLPRCNVFGLANSAYRAQALERCLPLPRGCVLIDWVLASRALATGATLWFDDVARMACRQHGRDAALLRPPFTATRLRTAAARVVAHYRQLLDGDWPWPPGSRGPFLAARARAEAFHRAIGESPETLANYCRCLNRLRPEYVWWWAVAHPDLEHVWRRGA